MPTGFDSILGRLADRDLVLPYFESGMLADNWPEKYTIPVDSSPYYGAGDGYFHPSTHPLMGERELYYRFHPDTAGLMVPERPSLMRQWAFAMGSALHAVIQTQLQMMNLVSADDIEVEYVNEAHHVRGRIDFIVNHPNGSRIPVEFKALACSTPILTTKGWSTMGELQDGDEVYAPDGQPTKVLKAHPIRLGRPCYEVRFRDGQSVVADEDHLWSAHDRNPGGGWRVLTTREIAGAKWSGRYRFRVPVTQPLQTPEANLPMDPWLLGMWLGDGSTGRAEICSGESDLPYLLDRLNALDIEVTVRRGIRAPMVYMKGVAPQLRRLGLLWRTPSSQGGLQRGTKFIPEQYMVASEQQRRQLLAGLMDSDGTAGDHQAIIGMNRRDLMRQVLQLVRSLGYRATWAEHRGRFNGQDAGPVYWVKFSTARGQSPFHMPRKKALFEARAAKGSPQNLGLNAIVAVEPVPTVPVRCITVAHEASLYVVGRGFVPTHNTRTDRKFAWQDEPEPSWIAQLNLGLDSQDIDMGLLMMVESGYPYRMTEFKVHRDRELLDGIYGKFDRVRQAIEHGQPPRHCCAPDSTIMKACCARYQCWLA